MKNLIALSFFHLLFCVATAQTNFIVSGNVKDKSGAPIPGTGVYVSDYKIATSTDNNGNFSISLKPGNYNLLFQSVGFKAINKAISINNQSIKVDAILEENVQQLTEITVRPDPDYQFYLSEFKKYFLGHTPYTLECKLINPQVLIIDFDKKERTLNIKTDEFLIIENNALGYKIKYLLKNFVYNYKTKMLYFEGYPTYEDLTGSSNKIKNWAKKRLIAYNGSPQHFYKSLYNGSIEKEGFKLHKIIRKKNLDRPSDSLLKANVSKAMTKGGDSLNYWLAQSRKPKEISYLIKAPILTDTLVKIQNETLKSINFDGILYVIYTKEKEPEEYLKSKNKNIKLSEISNEQVTYINMLKSPIYFYGNGGIFDPLATLYEGYWTWEAIADSVPLDYEPLAK
jgi:hypothetical protein